MKNYYKAIILIAIVLVFCIGLYMLIRNPQDPVVINGKTKIFYIGDRIYENYY